MNANTRKIAVLCGKDARDVLQNPTMLVSCLMPIGFMLLYRYMMRRMGGDAVNTSAGRTLTDGFLMSTAAIFTIAMVGSMVLLSTVWPRRRRSTRCAR